MRFKAHTDEELNAQDIWPVGEYSFEVLEKIGGAKEICTANTKSKAGNDMIVLVLKVFNQQGDEQIVIDYLLEATPKKLKRAAYACHLGESYEAEILHASDFVGKTGTLKLTIQPERPKADGSGNYPSKNSVADYIPVQVTPAPRKEDLPPLDDEIPFY